MNIYHAEVEYTTRVIVKVMMPDGEEPTDEDIWEALSWPQYHLDEQTFDEQIISVEQVEE
jgi:hypothetical protein